VYLDPTPYRQAALVAGAGKFLATCTGIRFHFCMGVCLEHTFWVDIPIHIQFLSNKIDWSKVFKKKKYIFCFGFSSNSQILEGQLPILLGGFGVLTPKQVGPFGGPTPKFLGKKRGCDVKGKVES
jgi:hypothetical protein